MVTDPIVWNRDHGRSKIHDGHREGEVQKATTAPPASEKPPVDSFEKTFTPSLESEAKPASESAGGLSISYHFDLFYQLSQKVSAKMGQKGLSRFTEVSATVAETFKGSFNLKIDAIGSFLNGTDKSLAISTETASRFMDSVEGLAELSPKALEDFLQEADRFFADLETVYGEAGGAFDKIRDQMKDQASLFFDQVGKIRTDASTEAELPAPETPELPELPKLDLLPGQPLGFITLADKSGMEFPARDYKSFVSNFLKYVERFRKNLVTDFLASVSRPAGYPKPIETSPRLGKEVASLEKPTESATPKDTDSSSLSSSASPKSESV